MGQPNGTERSVWDTSSHHHNVVEKPSPGWRENSCARPRLIGPSRRVGHSHSTGWDTEVGEQTYSCKSWDPLLCETPALVVRTIHNGRRHNIPADGGWALEQLGRFRRR